MIDAEPPSEKKQFWATIPGILTGIAAVLTAVTGLVALLFTEQLAGGDRSDHSQFENTETPAADPLPDGTPSSSEPPTSASRAGRVLKQGNLDMRPGDWAELASGTVGSGSTEFDYYLALIDYGTRGVPTLYRGQFARSRASPTFNECASLLRTRQDSELDVSANPQGEQVGPGDWFCLREGPNQMASIKVTRVLVDPPRVSLDYTLWHP